jgi:CMP-2-keto-3-deoxyoctulosonic acid synthetase
VIPARIGSTRLPGKPLRLLGGEPLIRRVVRRAFALGLEAPVVVAADDPAVLAAVAGTGAVGVLTSPDLRSGTERVAAAMDDPIPPADIVLNVQVTSRSWRRTPPRAPCGACGTVTTWERRPSRSRPTRGGARTG